MTTNPAYDNNGYERYLYFLEQWNHHKSTNNLTYDKLSMDNTSHTKLLNDNSSIKPITYTLPPLPHLPTERMNRTPDYPILNAEQLWVIILPIINLQLFDATLTFNFPNDDINSKVSFITNMVEKMTLKINISRSEKDKLIHKIILKFFV